MRDLELEKKRLEETISIIQKLLEEEQLDLTKLYKNFIGDREELWRIADRKKIHISNLMIASDNPYFARIDFTREEDGKTSSVYIGKKGIIKNSNIIVTDWRAPISSLYYDSELGECSYESPKGTISGILTLKRQFEIEKGKLNNYFDVDIVSNDVLLQQYLNENNESRLKNIISTIQKEQNDVIRRSLYNNLIIQGVAGSGKTTVALHRIAYLVYNYMNSIKQSQYMVIGPNPVFLKYIKSVLPELDVSGVSQYTYEQFAKQYIEESLEIKSSEKKAVANISGKNNTDIDKFKCSIKYKNMIDEFLKIYFYSITSQPLMLGNFEILSKETVEKAFVSTENSSNLKTRIELTTEILCKIIENNYDDIISRYNEYSFTVFDNCPTNEERNKLRLKFIKERAEIEKLCKNTIKKYFSKTKIEPTKLYKIFISTINDFDIYKYKNLAKLKKETLQNIKQGSYDFEDLAALIYIKSMISPEKSYEQIRHIVIDEAQDLGEFNFYSLKKSMPNATFSIFGDLAQSIYDYRGINNWQEVNYIMFNNNGDIVNFNKSYRTTSEIMSIADDVAYSIGLNKSDLVVRRGKPVNFTKIEKTENIAPYIIKKIEEYKKKGYKTIAIISKTDLLSNYLNDDLAALGLIIPNVTINDDLSSERFNICTISNQLSKGLEFDAVIINDASEDIYSSKSSLDMKLLYVAITRALHELEVIYTKTLTKPLESHVQKEKKLIKK